MTQTNSKLTSIPTHLQLRSLTHANGPTGLLVTSSATHRESQTRHVKRRPRHQMETAERIWTKVCTFQQRSICVTSTTSALVSNHWNLQTLNHFFAAPFLFGPWMNTELCNESCGTARFYLEFRTCVPVSPNLPANFSCQDQPTLRTGNVACPPSNISCTGYISNVTNTMKNCKTVPR